MAQADKSSKTEPPSHKKLNDAKKKGDVPKSQEVNNLFILGAAALLVGGFGTSAALSIATTLKGVIANADRYDIGGGAFGIVASQLTSTILLTVLMPLSVLSGAGLVANLVQNLPLISVEPIKPKFSKIDPLAGAKRLFSPESLVNFGKGVLKIIVVGVVTFFAIWPERDRFESMVMVDVVMLLPIFQEFGGKIFGAVLAILLILAIVDYMYQRHNWWTKHKMTVQEVRDEHKQIEGDPVIKGRIRQIRFERGRQRMMANVMRATVVVTNPTHYAVALKYERSMPAPVCVAKGSDEVALRIRELAREHAVPIVENPPLARALFASVEIDQPISTEHFKAVAQVIGFVMRTARKAAWRV